MSPAAVTAVLAGLCASAAAGEPPPLETFFKDYLYDDMVVSPSGRYLAAIYPSNGTKNIAIVDLEQSKGAPLTGVRKPSEVAWVSWVSDERLVYGLRETDKLQLRVLNIVGVDRDGKNHRRIAGPGLFDEGSGTVQVSFRYFQEHIVSWLPDDADHILISSDAEKPNFPEVFRLNVHSGKRRIDTRPAGRRARYLADLNGIVRIAETHEEDLTQRLLYRGSDRGEWRELMSFRFDQPHLDALGFAADNRLLYVLSTIDRDKHALYTYDPEKRELVELLFEHPQVDVDDAVFTQDRQRLIGVSYITDRVKTHYFDPEIAGVVEAIHEAFPGMHIQFANHTRDHSRSVLRIDSGRSPGAYYLFDSDKLTVTELAQVAPWIDPQAMPETVPFNFEARDGLELNGFLTLPADGPAEKLPTVVVPHGGPYFVRDTRDFDPAVKFLASRGYAVVQVNFRGSYGFGREYQQAGFREFGGSMQDDVTDATRWAIERGYADRHKICIFGASYGGYAALVGLIKEPGLYRCGISYVGVTDLSMLFQTKAFKWGMIVGDKDAQKFWEIAIGDPTDEPALRARSPLHNAAKIQAPVFIAQGGEDWIVHVDHATALRKELDRLGKPYEWLLKEDEGHGFFEEANRIELYGRIERFLARHLQ